MTHLVRQVPPLNGSTEIFFLELVMVGLFDIDGQSLQEPQGKVIFSFSAVAVYRS